MNPQRRPNHRPPAPPPPAQLAGAHTAAWRATGTAPAHPAALEQLECVLRDLLGAHEQMLTLTAEHRRAMSEADIGALQKCMTSQGDVARTISTLERQRQTIVAGLTGQRPGTVTPVPGGAPGAVRVTMRTLATDAPEPVRTRLISVADALRDLLNTLHREHMSLRHAAETLSSHMEGVMRQVCRTLSHAGTYARTGAIDSTVQVAAALDVRT